MEQKRTKKASLTIHVVILGVWNANRDSVALPKQENPAMILCVVFLRGTYNAPHTFQNLVMIDVRIVTHLLRSTIIVIHLTVYEVVPSPLDFYDSS